MVNTEDNEYNRNEDNDVNETEDGLLSGNDGVHGQAPLGRQQATGRRKWNNALYRVVMECYYESNPGTRGYRRRMLNNWQNRGMFRLSEQNLADQARAIRNNNWLSTVELEEIKRGVSRETGDESIENMEREPASRDKCEQD